LVCKNFKNNILRVFKVLSVYLLRIINKNKKKGVAFRFPTFRFK